MAKVTFGPIVAEARGRQGNLVFSRNQYGAYTSPYTAPVETSSPARVVVWTRMLDAATAWNDDLEDSQRRAWQGFAKKLDYRDVFGRRKNHSGRPMFISNYMNLETLTLPINLDPPASSDRYNLTSSSLTLNTDTPTLELNLEWDPLQPQPPVLVDATPPLNAGRSRPGHRFTRIATLGDTTAYPYELWTAYTNRFPVPTTGQKIFVHARPIHPSTGLSGVKLLAADQNAGTGVPMYIRTTVLTNAQIKALPTTAISIIPATAGKLIVPHTATLQLECTAGAYTNISAGAGNNIYLSAAGTKTTAVRNDSLLTPAGKRTVFLTTQSLNDANPNTVRTVQADAFIDSTAAGVALSLSVLNPAGDFTGGNAANALTVTVWYELINPI